MNFGRASGVSRNWRWGQARWIGVAGEDAGFVTTDKVVMAKLRTQRASSRRGLNRRTQFCGTPLVSGDGPNRQGCQQAPPARPKQGPRLVDVATCLRASRPRPGRWRVCRRGSRTPAAHGHPRFTKDLELWILLDPANAARLIEALDDLGFASLDLRASDFLVEDTIVQLGYPPKRIDLLTTVSGVDFADCWERRARIEIGGVLVPFIGVDDLVANKRAAGRPQDIADVAALEAPPRQGE